MFSRPMKTRLTPARAGFLDEAGNAVAERVDLNHQLESEALLSRSSIRRSKIGSQLRLRAKLSSVMKKLRHALGVIGAHDRLDVVGRAVARLAALHVDDGAEAALERTAAAGVEAGARLMFGGGASDAAGTGPVHPRGPAGRCRSRRAVSGVPLRRREAAHPCAPSASPAKIETPSDQASWISGGSSGSIASCRRHGSRRCRRGCRARRSGPSDIEGARILVRIARRRAPPARRPPARLKSRMILPILIRWLVSSATEMRISTSSPSTRRSAQSLASP